MLSAGHLTTGPSICDLCLKTAGNASCWHSEKFPKDTVYIDSKTSDVFDTGNKNVTESCDRYHLCASKTLVNVNAHAETGSEKDNMKTELCVNSPDDTGAIFVSPLTQSSSAECEKLPSCVKPRVCVAHVELDCYLAHSKSTESRKRSDICTLPKAPKISSSFSNICGKCFTHNDNVLRARIQNRCDVCHSTLVSREKRELKLQAKFAKETVLGVDIPLTNFGSASTEMVLTFH